MSLEMATLYMKSYFNSTKRNMMREKMWWVGEDGPPPHLPPPPMEHGTLGLLGLSPSVLGGGTLGNPPHNMWTPQSPLVRGSSLSIKVL